jgi:hypothetical protein
MRRDVGGGGTRLSTMEPALTARGERQDQLSSAALSWDGPLWLRRKYSTATLTAPET